MTDYGKNRLNPQTGEWKTEWHEVTDYNKLVEALEYVKDYENADLARQLIEENERLTQALEAEQYRAGEARGTYHVYRDQFQSRLSAAEEHHTLAHQFGDDTEDLLDQLKRAEEVVEAAKALYSHHRTDTLDDAIRRYEEGKKEDVTPGESSDR